LAGSQSNGQGYCLRVDRARPWQWAPACPALMNIDAHRFEDTYLCFLDAPSEAVDSWKILTVSVVLAAFAFDGNRVCVKPHGLIVLHDMVEFSLADAPQATLQTVTLGGSALFGTSKDHSLRQSPRTELRRGLEFVCKVRREGSFGQSGPEPNGRPWGNSY